MRTLSLTLQLHQPFRLKRYHFFDIGRDSYYYDDYENKSIIQKVAQNCYLPTNKLLAELFKIHGDRFKLSLSISGVALDQLEAYAPRVIESFQELAKTGQVEFLSETYGHSLASLRSEEEFTYQVRLHARKIKSLFGQSPKVFRNTEMVYSDHIGELVGKLGFQGVITEGAKHVLGWKSPHFVYFNPHNPKVKILLRHYELSDDLAFRFSDQTWSEWPLTTEKYVAWLNTLDPQDKITNLVLSYETFGEHHAPDSGIFEFLKALPNTLKKESDYRFGTPSEILARETPKAELNIVNPVSWADSEKDLTAWLGNEMQEEAFEKLYKLRPIISELSDKLLKKDWMYLQASDHFYYLSTKFHSDGSDQNRFTPYDSPYEAFINYMNILSDFARRLGEAIKVDKVDEILLKDGAPEEIEALIKKSQKILKEVKRELRVGKAQKPASPHKSPKKKSPKSPNSQLER